MNNELRNITFDRTRNPGIEFDLIPLEQIYTRQDLDHDPKQLHRVEFYLLVLITSGSGRHTIDFKEYNYRSGSILTIRKDQIHKFHESSAAGFLLLFTEEFANSHLESESARKISELYNELFFQQLTELNDVELKEYLTIVKLINKEFYQLSDSHTSGIVRNLLQVLMSKVYRKREVHKQFRKDHKYIRFFLKFQRLVEQKCLESRSVQFYADNLHITTKTLNNISNNVVGKSCKTFIDEVLILQIKRQLINSKLSIKEIAHHSGFSEASNLFKFFKRYTAQTPESFRANFK